MPRGKKAAPTPNGEASSIPASVGHNTPPLTEEEASALTTHYALKIIADSRKVEAAKVELDSAKSVVNGHFKLISKDLGFTRAEFQAEVIAKLNMSDGEYRMAESRRDRLHRLAGLKPGEQIDLIDHVLKDTVDDALAAEADGYRAGRRADDPFPPENIAPILHPDWMRGYHQGQEFNGKQLAMASEILARPKPGEMAAAPEGGEDEGDEDLDQAARDLKASGWTAPTAEEAAFS